MRISESIQEEHAPLTTLQVFHRRLRIPLESYLNTVEEFTDPWNERAYQYFIQKYLEEINDQGIVGMVRQEHDQDFIYLDAAIRYPLLTDSHFHDSQV
jgi:hypothetical protein